MEASPQELLSQYSEIRECDFKERHYSVRDNGCNIPVSQKRLLPIQTRLYMDLWVQRQ